MKYQIEIPENSRIMQRFKMVHPRLYHWFHTGLGMKYLKRQYERIEESDLEERMIGLNDIGIPLRVEHYKTLDEEVMTDLIIKRVKKDANKE